MSNLYNELMKLKNKGESAIVVTVVDKSGSGPVEIGKKMLIGASGFAFGTVGGGSLEFHAREKCKDLLKERKNLLQKYILNEGQVVEDATTLPMICGGAVTLFYEFVGANANIYIFGGGHVGQALCNVLKTMNYYVTVIDAREPIINDFVGADRKVHQDFTEFIEQEGIEEGSYVVVCTPSHKYDYNVLHKVIELKFKPKYMGMLCSAAKLHNYIEKTHKMYGNDIELSNFYSPIGLDIGGDSPEEIAVSISAEILTIQYDKKGHKHMRVTNYLESEEV